MHTSETDPNLPNGTYDVMVVDVENEPGPAGEESSGISLVIVTGPLKGQVVTLDQHLRSVDTLLRLGSPGRLTVNGQELRLQLES
ncbi:MAG: hypothetical protein ACYCZV_16540 [Acidimicrobiales bacterium]